MRITSSKFRNLASCRHGKPALFRGVKSKRTDLFAAAHWNFMEIATLYHSLKKRAVRAIPAIVRAGRSFDRGMSPAFVNDLGFLDPDYRLEIGRGCRE